MFEETVGSSRWSQIAVKTGIMLLVIFFLGLIPKLMFVDFVDSYQLGYKYDARSGSTTVLDSTGYIVTPPFVVKVHTVDLRPMQVCINANARVLNCKLVKFNRDGLGLFLKWHGRGDYDGGTNLNQILMSYAYDGSGKIYPFLDVLRELKPDDTEVPQTK